MGKIFVNYNIIQFYEIYTVNIIKYSGGQI